MRYYTRVFVGRLKGHRPVGHLHVQSTYRLPHIRGQSPRLFLALHQIFQFVVRLGGQLEQRCHSFGDLRVRLVPVGRLQDLVFGLHTQPLLNSCQTQRLLPDPPQLEIAAQPYVSHSRPYGFIRNFIGLALHAGQSLQFVAAIGAKEDEDVLEALEGSPKLVLA